MCANRQLVPGYWCRAKHKVGVSPSERATDRRLQQMLLHRCKRHRFPAVREIGNCLVLFACKMWAFPGLQTSDHLLYGCETGTNLGKTLRAQSKKISTPTGTMHFGIRPAINTRSSSSIEKRRHHVRASPIHRLTVGIARRCAAPVVESAYVAYLQVCLGYQSIASYSTVHSKTPRSNPGSCDAPR